MILQAQSFSFCKRATKHCCNSVLGKCSILQSFAQEDINNCKLFDFEKHGFYLYKHLPFSKNPNKTPFSFDVFNDIDDDTEDGSDSFWKNKHCLSVEYWLFLYVRVFVEEKNDKSSSKSEHFIRCRLPSPKSRYNPI